MAIAFIALDFLTVAVGGSNAGGSVAHLGGAAFGFVLFKKRAWLNVFEHDFGNFGEKWKRQRVARRRHQQEQIEREVDRILAKVSHRGLQSLTEREKRTLKKATQSERGR